VQTAIQLGLHEITDNVDWIVVLTSWCASVIDNHPNRHMPCRSGCIQDAQLSQRDRAAGCVI